jgi:hypothetical protein
VGRKKALTEEQIKEVREIYAFTNISMEKLGEMYFVSAAAICRYVNSNKIKKK